VTNISEINELIKYFLPEKILIPRKEKNWESFDNQ